MAINSINPATEEVIATYEQFTPEQTEQALAEADAAFRQWRATSFAERAGLMRRAAELLAGRKDRYASLITAEMGKPITQAEAEVEKCAWACNFYADNAERFLAHEPVRTNAHVSTSRSSPSASCWRSCPGTSPSGRCFALPRQP